MVFEIIGHSISGCSGIHRLNQGPDEDHYPPVMYFGKFLDWLGPEPIFQKYDRQ